MTQTLRYIRNDSGILNINLMNIEEGKENELLASRAYDCNTLPETNRVKGMVYGISKLCAERTSEISPGVEKLDAIDEVWEALLTGEWERERKKGGGPTVRIEVEALAALRKISVKQAQTLLKKYDKDAQEKIFANPAVAKQVKKIEDAQAKVSDDVTFDDLIPAEATEDEGKQAQA